jgi:hypothetical protein
MSPRAYIWYLPPPLDVPVCQLERKRDVHNTFAPVVEMGKLGPDDENLRRSAANVGSRRSACKSSSYAWLRPARTTLKARSGVNSSWRRHDCGNSERKSTLTGS